MNPEAELASKVVAWLKDQHWKVYQEVRILGGGPRADIVAVQCGRYWVIECKQSMGLAVLAQCMQWKPWANWVSAATQHSRIQYTQQICKACGIGWLRVLNEVSNIYGSNVDEYSEPCLNRKIVTGHLAGAIAKMPEDHETYGSAGNNAGQFYSPFKKTCREVLQYVNAHPGCGIKELVENIKTHYRSPATARAVLPAWINKGCVPGVKIELVSRKITLHPKIEASLA